MRLRKKQLSAILLSLFAVAATRAADNKWVASWGSSPVEGKIVVPGVPPDQLPPSPVLRGTVRYRLPLSEGGTRLILRITNEASKDALTLGAVTVAIADAGVSARPNSIRAVTFGGQHSVTLPAGAPAVSDAIDIPTRSSEVVLVSLFLPNDTQCPFGQRGIQAVTVATRDATQEPILEGALPTTARTLVSAILVENKADAKTIVAYGDSITDGAVTDTPDVRGWPGHLALRLMKAHGHAHFSVANEGIGGNRLLSDVIGQNALARFDRDVTALPNVTHLVLLEGINDIGFPNMPGNTNPPPQVEAKDLIAAYHQLIARAHQHGIKVIGGTLLPFKNAMYYTEAGERTRQSVNEWIRSGGEFDAVVDFDHALRDPADFGKLASVYDSGDHLHPSDSGYLAMSKAIDLGVFSRSK